jgi:hypothetical protein
MNREDWLSLGVAELRPFFKSIGHTLPDKVRVTCGFPSKGARSRNKAIGEHWASEASDGSYHEIMISPVVNDPYEVFGILVHELIHSVTVGQGHMGDFPRICKKLFLEGKPTATVIGDNFRKNFSALIDSLGDYPHDRLNVSANKKTQSTRMLKATCGGCGYVIRLTKTHADKGLPTCVCGTDFQL